jgi:uncharacterized protein (TIGR03086 family)
MSEVPGKFPAQENASNDTSASRGTDSPSQRFAQVAGAFTGVVSAVRADQWDLPAPCEGWVARDVVRHLVVWVPSVVGKGGVQFRDTPSVDDDPKGAWLHLAGRLQAALDDPAVAAHTFDAGPPGMMSVSSVIDMLVTGDVLVHTWDLATSVGRSVELEPGVVAGMLAGMEPIDDLLRSSGHYGPKVAVPADADMQTKLIAFTGRDPFWTAPKVEP